MNSSRTSLPSLTQGSLYFFFMLFLGTLNDAIVQHLSNKNVHLSTVTFMRLALGLLCMLPWVVRTKKPLLTPNFPMHIARGLLTFLALLLWSHGVSHSSVVTATLINFMNPIFTLLFAMLFLSERPSWRIWIAALIGLVGNLITLSPAGLAFNAYSTSFILSTLAFVTLDIIAKKYVTQEPLLNICFWVQLVATLLAALFWIQERPLLPSIELWPYLGLLGLNGALLFFCLLKAYQHAPISYLMPLRPTELIFSIALQYLFFQKIPIKTELIGASLIIPASFFVLFHQAQKKV